MRTFSTDERMPTERLIDCLDAFRKCQVELMRIDSELSHGAFSETAIEATASVQDGLAQALMEVVTGFSSGEQGNE